MKDIGYPFWHEQNGLNMVDNIELLEDNNKFMQNLNLTYAVRDGIISHCGEIDENSVKPRTEFIDLSNYSYPNQYAPYTWEACVVKISDKISYICRDIEDAITLNILDENLRDLYNLLDVTDTNEPINNTVIINNLIHDLCENSSPEKGLQFSEHYLKLMDKIKEFNYKNIYSSERIKPSTRYFKLVLTEIYNTLKSKYDGLNTFKNLETLKNPYPKLYESFNDFLQNYYDCGNRDILKLKNKVLFSFENPLDFYKSIIHYISGMTDNFAIEIYNEIIHF